MHLCVGKSPFLCADYMPISAQIESRFLIREISWLSSNFLKVMSQYLLVKSHHFAGLLQQNRPFGGIKSQVFLVKSPMFHGQNPPLNHAKGGPGRRVGS